MNVRKPRRVRTVRRKNRFARDLRARSTHAERRAWQLLRGRRLLGMKFRRQYPLYGFIVDFYNKPRRLAIEVDGGIHDDPMVADYDRWREKILRSHGIHIVRIRNEHVSAESLLALIEPFVDGS